MKHGLLSGAGAFFALSVIAPFLYGQISFFQPPSYAGNGVVFTADFNGDGKPDLLSGDGTLQLGNGDGTFTAGATVSGTPLAIADFNGDGRPDVLEMGTGTLVVRLGNGDGTFQAPVTTASGAALQPIAAADLNGDGKADVVGIYNNSLLVYLGNGDGTFQPGVPYSLSAGSTEIPLFISFADFNGDGKTDVAVMMAGVNVAGEEVVFLANGDGTFQAAKTSGGIPSLNSSTVGDFNGDGKPDLLLNNGGNSCSSGCGVFFLAGNGDGTFQPPILSIANLGGIMAAADLNGDGKLDLVLEIQGLAVQSYSGNGDGTFSKASTYWIIPAFDAFNGVAIADFNLDGKPDIAVGNSLLLGNGDGRFQAIQVAPTSGNPTIFNPYFSFAAVGKFDNRQSVPDVAVATATLTASVYSFSIGIFANDGHGGLSLSHSYPLDAPAVGVAAGDFNGDGNLDLLVVTRDPTTTNWAYDVLLGNGDGSFQSPVFYPQNVRNGAYAVGNSVLVRDFNRDGKMDVAVGGLIDQSLAILLGNGDGTFAPATYIFDGGDTSLVSADFNGDGNLDIAAATDVDNENATALLFGNGDGTFQAAVFPASLNGFAPLFAADLNNDGKTDLVSNGQVALGNGGGTFTLLPIQPYAPIGVADFNGDGIPDLFVFSVANQTGVLTGNGDGTFSSFPVNVPRLGTIPTPLMIADMNNDGRPDIVFLSQSGFNSVGVLLNTTPPNFSISASALSSSTVTAGSSTSATIGVDRGFGFSPNVLLTCSGLPSGASCAFTPSSVPSGTAASSLVISTSSSTAAGTYPIEVVGSAGGLTSQVVLSIAVQAPPDFTITGPSTTSQTVSAGQSAMFSLSLAPAASFSGTVMLGCAIAPVASPAPTCTLSSPSVQLSGTAAQTVNVTIGTTAPVTTNARTALGSGLPAASIPLLVLLSLQIRRSRKRISMLAVLIIAALFTSLIGCSGGSRMGSGSQTSPGTPAGSYVITVTATSGSLVHDTVLQVIVQ